MNTSASASTSVREMGRTGRPGRPRPAVAPWDDDEEGEGDAAEIRRRSASSSSWACHECDRVFASENGLKSHRTWKHARHQQVALGAERTHKSEFGERKSDLTQRHRGGGAGGERVAIETRHKRGKSRIVRTEEGTFLCGNPECGLKFKQKATAQRHYREQHTNLKRLRCRLCGAGFKRSEHVKYHMKSNHGIVEDRKQQENAVDPADYYTFSSDSGTDSDRGFGDDDDDMGAKRGPYKKRIGSKQTGAKRGRPKSKSPGRPLSALKRARAEDDSDVFSALRRRSLSDAERDALLSFGETGSIEFLLRFMTSPENDWLATENWRCVNTIEAALKKQVSGSGDPDLIKEFNAIKVKTTQIAKLSSKQLAALEAFFQRNADPSHELRAKLADHCNISVSRVSAWFGRRRNRAAKNGEKLTLPRGQHRAKPSTSGGPSQVTVPTIQQQRQSEAMLAQFHQMKAQRDREAQQQHAARQYAIQRQRQIAQQQQRTVHPSHLESQLQTFRKSWEVLTVMRNIVRSETNIWKVTAAKWGALDAERAQLEIDGRKRWLKLEIERRARATHTDNLVRGRTGCGVADSDIPLVCQEIKQEFTQLRAERDALVETRERMLSDIPANHPVNNAPPRAAPGGSAPPPPPQQTPPPPRAPAQPSAAYSTGGQSKSDAIELD